jgi:hypothetical protein
VMGIKPASAALLCASILLLCSVLSIDRGQVAVGPRAASIRMPCVCLFKSITGRDCPFCGLTRSLVSIGHLDLRNGWRYNPAGFLVYLLIAYQLFASLALVRKGRGAGSGTAWRPLTTRASYALSAILLVTWIIRLMET